MDNITKHVDKVLAVQIWLNVIFLIVFIFFTPKWLIISSAALNLILVLTYKTIRKYAGVINMAVTARKSLQFLNNTLGKLDG